MPPKRNEDDIEIRYHMVMKWLDSKGLEYKAENFNKEEFDKWCEDKAVIDNRANLKGSGRLKMISVAEVLNMGQKEANEKGVGDFRRKYLEENGLPSYEELKEHLKTMNHEERIDYQKFETLRNVANGYSPNYNMKDIFDVIDELHKEEKST